MSVVTELREAAATPDTWPETEFPELSFDTWKAYIRIRDVGQYDNDDHRRTMLCFAADVIESGGL